MFRGELPDSDIIPNHRQCRPRKPRPPCVSAQLFTVNTTPCFVGYPPPDPVTSEYTPRMFTSRHLFNFLLGRNARAQNKVHLPTHMRVVRGAAGVGGACYLSAATLGRGVSLAGTMPGTARRLGREMDFTWTSPNTCPKQSITGGQRCRLW